MTYSAWSLQGKHGRASEGQGNCEEEDAFGVAVVDLAPCLVGEAEQVRPSQLGVAFLFLMGTQPCQHPAFLLRPSSVAPFPHQFGWSIADLLGCEHEWERVASERRSPPRVNIWHIDLYDQVQGLSLFI